MQLRHPRGRTSGVQTAPGNGAVSQAMPGPGHASAGLAAPGMAAQFCVMASLLADAASRMPDADRRCQAAPPSPGAGPSSEPGPTSQRADNFCALLVSGAQSLTRLVGPYRSSARGSTTRQIRGLLRQDEQAGRAPDAARLTATAWRAGRRVHGRGAASRARLLAGLEPSVSRPTLAMMTARTRTSHGQTDGQFHTYRITIK